MKKILFCICFFTSTAILAKEMICFTKTEIGESKQNNEKLYERSDTLNAEQLSKIDFDNLTIIGTSGISSKMQKLSNNIYTSSGKTYTFFYLTNTEKTIVQETSISTNSIYTKVLFCK